LNKKREEILRNYMQIETDAFFNIGNLYYVRGIFDDTFYKNAREIFLLTIKNA